MKAITYQLQLIVLDFPHEHILHTNADVNVALPVMDGCYSNQALTPDL
jgi:hypothetical protein